MRQKKRTKVEIVVCKETKCAGGSDEKRKSLLGKCDSQSKPNGKSAGGGRAMVVPSEMRTEMRKASIWKTMKKVRT